MFGFLKRKKKQESPAQEVDESRQDAALDHEDTTGDGAEPSAEEARRAVETVDPESSRAAEFDPAPHETEAAREALDTPEATPRDGAMGEAYPLDPNAEALAEDAAPPREETASPSSEGASSPAAAEETTLAEPEPEPEPEPRPDAVADDTRDVPPEAPAAQDDARAEDDAAAAAPREQPQERPKKAGWFARIKAGLGKTRANFTEGLAGLFLGKKQIDDDLMEDLETQLLMADVGIEATTEIIDRLTERVSRKELKDPQALYSALQEELQDLLDPVAQPLALPPKGQGPFVILMVGVNGVGKTTTIGKLTQRFQREGRSVMLAAGDTFRAAAVEQLKVWGERNHVPVVAQHTGADSASVIYDALSAAKARGVDVLIADTAGRLHNKSHLMEELKKVRRVMAKLDEQAPHEVMLVLDAGTGQNALSQASTFNEAVPVTGITLTKLDGTAKGGIIFALAKQLGTPIRFIGVGETLDDLRPFAAEDFVSALFERDTGGDA
ncbi:signal recognition particle-docking protein FtsY [Chromohalobacter israelensis]|uniref:signal recognition particle-docking protein FtsY n=1 Tax=Chromohalobacter israelensis TaxID=141390 RepID=UPI00265C4458|nr:signal recognition particle-docking protein FtsY [Chromohalobacter salexigens]MDO0946196.1 signal recognition particle-docking protein FtsY [Chromohalobacter salexigens]